MAFFFVTLFNASVGARLQWIEPWFQGELYNEKRFKSTTAGNQSILNNFG